MELFDPAGHRLYLAADERAAFLEAAKSAPREVRSSVTFCTTRAAACPKRWRYRCAGWIWQVLETLKKRRRGVYRAVPIPWKENDRGAE